MPDGQKLATLSSALCLLCLDLTSCKHVGVWFICFRVPGKLKQFVLDLHSGKLHREFHHGPDPTDVAPGQVRLQKIHLICPFNKDVFPLLVIGILLNAYMLLTSVT